MSNALAIAGVSAVLKDLLDSGMIDHQVTDTLGAGVLVSSLAPDVVPIDGDGAVPRLNLFLYQVTPNAGWRNVELPSRDASGRRVKNPPLALDLHYLLTAYGIADLQAEVLLGYGMQLLHENPVLPRAAIRKALNPSPVSSTLLPSVYAALRSADLAEQVEMLKITPSPMGTEEISRLWSALQAHYRPTAAFQVSVVLIEPQTPAISPLPVLTRGRPIPGGDEGISVTPGLVPPYPTIETALAAAHGTPSTVQLGDAVTIRGHHLAGSQRAILLRSDRFQIVEEIDIADGDDEFTLKFNVPNIPNVTDAKLPVGLYQLQLRVQRPDGVRVSNVVPLALAPTITSFPPLAMTRGVVDGVPNVLSLTLGCEPNVRVGQAVTLLVDGRATPARPFTVETATLTFRVADAPPAGGTPLLRLQVDGIESIVVNRVAKPPTYLNHRITLPA